MEENQIWSIFEAIAFVIDDWGQYPIRFQLLARLKLAARRQSRLIPNVAVDLIIHGTYIYQRVSTWLFRSCLP
jgi:hypothetical protein